MAGDGISDLGWRGELGDQQSREYIRDRIGASGVLKIHERSATFLSNRSAIKATEKEGEILLDNIGNGWWRIIAP